jgi:hypothetical protein
MRLNKPLMNIPKMKSRLKKQSLPRILQQCRHRKRYIQRNLSLQDGILKKDPVLSEITIFHALIMPPWDISYEPRMVDNGW